MSQPDEHGPGTAIAPEYHANCERRARQAERDLIDVRAILARETTAREDAEGEVGRLRAELDGLREAVERAGLWDD